MRLTSDSTRILITGSSGLIGGQAVEFFDTLGWEVIGIDGNQRMQFFGPEGDTTWQANKLLRKCNNFSLHKGDIRNKDYLEFLFKKYKFDLVLHLASQPAHDYSYENPYEDFQVNTVGTVNLLEATRLFQPETPFIFTSTSKVYGTAVNEYEFVEEETRYDYNEYGFGISEDYQLSERGMSYLGITEKCRIDNTLHSMFGCNKAAADLICQEYGKYFGLKTVILRPGCLTGSGHSSVELHGFLSYLIKCVLEGREYKVFGYKMKQVRDNIHSYDVVTACYELFKNMPNPGEVFNLGGERENSISILEAFDLAKKMTGKEPVYKYVDEARRGDHIVYISDMYKFHTAYPNWNRKYNLEMIFDDIIKGYKDK